MAITGTIMMMMMIKVILFYITFFTMPFIIGIGELFWYLYMRQKHLNHLIIRNKKGGKTAKWFFRCGDLIGLICIILIFLSPILLYPFVFCFTALILQPFLDNTTTRNLIFWAMLAVNFIMFVFAIIAFKLQYLTRQEGGVELYVQEKQETISNELKGIEQYLAEYWNITKSRIIEWFYTHDWLITVMQSSLLIVVGLYLVFICVILMS